MKKRVLVIGGYGGFGARISRRLASAGYEVLVAGRDARKAAAFCAGQPSLVPTPLPNEQDLAGALERHRPFAVVDAAGPFQGATYRIARACITAGCHCLDIADGREFVAGIGVLDAEARAAGVAIISGASSVPALSGAVVRSLAAGVDDIRAVEMAISASSRATVGASVTRAILSYVGKPIRLWRGGRWVDGYGWQDLRVERFAFGGVDQLGPRLVALADVPDLELLPARLPGRPTVVFRAGTERALANLGLWLLSWLVRCRALTSLTPLSPILLHLQSLTSQSGGDRSGMLVRLFGVSAERRFERRWTLVASDGDGPEIPALAVPILIDALAAGSLPPGARDAGSSLALEDFESAFAELSIRHEVSEIEAPRPLYARVMGDRYDALPDAVRRMHDVLRDAGAGGRAIVVRGRSRIASVIAALFGLPGEGECDVHVSFREADGVESWTRDFGGRSFSSRLSQEGDHLVERFGPFRFVFELTSDAKGLAMRMVAWRCGPLPLPLRFAPRSPAREWEEHGCCWFDVPIAMPFVGEIVHYSGWLQRSSGRVDEQPGERSR